MVWRRGCVWVKKRGGGPEAIQNSGLEEIMRNIKRTECSKKKKKGVVLKGKQSLGSTWAESTSPQHCLCMPALGPLWPTTTASSYLTSLSLLLPHIRHHSTKLFKVSPSHPLAWTSLPVSWHLQLSSPGPFLLSPQSGCPDLSVSNLDGLGDGWGVFASPVPCALTSGQEVPPLLHPTHLVFGSTSPRPCRLRCSVYHQGGLTHTFQRWAQHSRSERKKPLT